VNAPANGTSRETVNAHSPGRYRQGKKNETFEINNINNMKKFKLIFGFIVFSCMTSVISAEVNVQGSISFSTTWTKALSPYNVVGDVQVPTGVTLTIEPGVEVRYTGDYELLVKGKLLANGTPADSIVFRSDVSGTKKGKRFLNFEGTNLATHQLTYFKMLDGNIGIQVGNETEYVQGDKNTGILIASHLRLKNTNVLTSGYGTGAQLLLDNGSLESGQIMGDYPRSEKISLNKMQVKNATLYSDSYNDGIWLDSCEVKNTIWTIGCCGANFNINHSTVEGGSFVPTNDSYSITIANSQITNLPMNLGAANTVSISNSAIMGGTNHMLICNNLTMHDTSIKGSGTGIGLELVGRDSIYLSTITGFTTGIKVNTNGNLSITNSNLSNNATYNIQNASTNNLTATQNWWGTSNTTDIAKLLWDKNDDINVGTISFTSQLSSPKITAPIIPPLNVIKAAQGSNVVVSWTANTETDISGYKIYYGSTDGIHFAHVINARNVTTNTLTGVSINDSIAVTAYDATADGVNDQIEGHESLYAIAGVPAAVISLSSTDINMGVAQLNNTISKKLLITNKGGSNLAISSVVSSSSLFSVNKTNFTVKPDSICELIVSFKPTSLGQITGTLTINHNSREKVSVIGLSGMGVTDAGTGVCGIISKDTVWRKANSPYYVLCDVQVPSGVTLTIESGVEVRYTGDYELLVKGKLLANGTPADSIVFRSDVSGTKKGKRFLNFEGTNLATHQLTYFKMLDGNIGIQVGNETEYVQGDKNTGILIASHLRLKNTNVLTSGYGTGAQLLLDNGSLESGQIMGDYPRSEKISLNKMQVKNATLYSDSYNDGIWLDSCEVKNTIWTIGCCGANFNINHSTVEGGSFVPTNDSYSITIANSQITNLPMNLGAANTVSISNSAIMGGTNHMLICNNLTMHDTSIKGSGTGIGLELVGRDSIYLSTITGFTTGIKVNTNGNLSITNSNLSNNATYNIQNASTNNLTATQNWWGTTDVAIINNKIIDKLDDINKGEVLYSPLLMSENGESNYVPVVNNFITPLLGEVPLEVTFKSSATDTDGSIKSYKWDFNGDNVYDFTSVLNGDTTVIYTKGGNFVTESNVSDNKNLSNRLFYKIAVIDFNSKSENLGDSTVIVNWGWGKYHTVVVEASAFNFLSEGDIINIYDNAGNTSSNCNSSNEHGKVLVSSLIYSTKNDSVYVFNCQPSVNMCTYNSTMKPGYIIGHQMFFEVQSTSSSFGINPTIIKSGSINFTDSAFTLISKFELGSVKSPVESQKKVIAYKSENVKNTTFNVYRNNILFKEGVSDLYILDKNINVNTEYCYDIYLVKNGTQILSKSTCVKAKINNSVKTVTSILSDIYPNPVREFLTISTKESLSGILVTIYDIYGNELLNKEINNSKTIINVDKLTSGIYFLKLTNNTKIEVRKFIKE
jgi:hypothetical protein